MRLLLILPALFLIEQSFGQITFQKTYGGSNVDWGNSVQITNDGGYIITGWTSSFGVGQQDVYLIKTNANGDTLWTKTFGGANNDRGYSVQQTNDGGYIVAGYTESFGVGNLDVFLIKADSSGNILWNKTYGGANIDWAWSVQQTIDSGYIILGLTESFGSGSQDVYLINTKENGDTLWTKTFGGTNYDEGYSVYETNDRGYIIIGETQSFGVNYADVYFIKTDSLGNILWNKTYGSTNVDIGFSAQQTNDGGFIISGSQSTLVGNTNVYLIKTDINGDTLWTRTFGGTSSDIGWSVQQTIDGGYIVAGGTQSFGNSGEVFLIKTNATGYPLWAKTFGGISYEWGNNVRQTADGGFIIVGSSTSFGAGNIDVYLIKTDSMGNSGCNESNLINILDTPNTNISYPVALTSSGGILSTPNISTTNGGVETTLCTSVSVKEVMFNNSFLIYPNPSKGGFIIKYQKPILNGEVEVLNTLGEFVFKEKLLNESVTEINLTNIAEGIYLVRVFEGDKFYSKKLIIQHD